MKNFLLLLLIPLFFACGESKEEIKLKQQVDSLMAITSQDQVSINEYLKAFNEIQMNLNEIKAKENIITTKTVGDIELEDTDVEAITNDILSIYELMQENKKKLGYLRNKLNKSDSKNKELQTTIKLLNDNIAQKDIDLANLRMLLQQKDVDITVLNEKIAEMDSEMAKMSFDNVKKDSVITQQQDEIHTAFYIIDTKKNLKEKGVLEPDGGFLGIGSNKKINLNEKEFTKIDTRKVKEINLNDATKIQLISDHPAESYKLVTNKSGKTEKIIITDFEKFWKMSKYLVISIK